MDSVIQQLGAAEIGGGGNEDKTNFESLYKNRGRTGNQEERRKEILDQQKVNRNSKLDRFRGVLQLVEAVEDDIFQTPRTHWKPTIYVSGFTKVPNYCDVLMMSEWMLEKPSDFEENWVAAPCPKGDRMLVVAYRGTTKFFNKYGNYRFECRTMLPGGNPCELHYQKNTVVLDGFYRKDDNTLYVLDILAWNNCVMTEGEASFRHFWMNGHLEQIPELRILTKKNEVLFKIIPKVPCTKESLNELLTTFPFYNHNIPPVDGLLFYHQKAQYFSGETPLVGWLYPFMVHEVLGSDIKLHKGYMLEKPIDYTDYIDFIKSFENKKSRKKQRRIFAPKDMEMGLLEDAVASTSGETNENAQVQDDNEKKKAMDTDNNTLAQGDSAVVGSTNGNNNASPSKEGENATPKTESMTEKMEEEEKKEGSTENKEATITTEDKEASTTTENMEADVNTKMEADTGNIEAENTTGNKMEAMVADIVEEK